MPMTGDFQRLQATIRGLRKLAQVPSQLAVPAAAASAREIDKSFVTATSPYGKRWAPHKPATVKRWGSHPLLQLTGAGRAAITVKARPGAGISVVSPSEGLMYAQGGTVHEVRRPFLPDDQMPATWNRALEKVATDAAQEALRGTG